jgi:hypothetical protein
VPEPLSRRSFLAAGAGALALAACGGGGDKSACTSASASTSAKPAFNLIGFYVADTLVAAAPQRLPFAIADSEGAFIANPPATLDFTIVGPDCKRLGSPITVASHKAGLPRPYYPLVFTPPTPGVYEAHAEVQGKPLFATFQFGTSTEVPSAGQPMIPFDTPTVANQQGVELLCTRVPACPLHDITLTEALAGKQPVAFLVATPMFCQTAICGPVLDVMLGLKDRFPQVTFLHSEVYPTQQAAQAASSVVPVVRAYKLTSEPVLFLGKADGTIAERIDTIFDGVELQDALTRLIG